MAPKRLYLKDGADPRHAVSELREVVDNSEDISAIAAGRPGGELLFRDHYLRWAENVERVLRNNTQDEHALEMLQTPRYWHIRELRHDSPRIWPLTAAEIKSQTAALTRLADAPQRPGRAPVQTPGAPHRP